MAERMCVLILLALGLSVAASGQPTDCSFYNQPLGPFYYNSSNSAEHSDGAHYFANIMTGSCTYSGTASHYSTVGCGLTAQARSSSAVIESGDLTNFLYSHYFNTADAQGIGSAGNGNGVTVDAEGAGAVQSCLFACGTTIGISGTGKGAGFSVSFTPVPLWSDKAHYVNACPGYTLQQILCPPVGNPPYPPAYGVNHWEWNTSSCQWQLVDNLSPIVVDTKKTGFMFTDPDRGDYVTFDIRGDGKPLKLSWPRHGSGNAWLVYDRNDDEVIKDGTELFGNFTPHSDAAIPNYSAANGFIALAWYDRPEQGGDGNLILDKRDPIWNKLRIWIDDHCYQAPDVPCQSLPQELHSLESAGIKSISLLWSAKVNWDAIGNEFKYYTVLNPEAHDTPKDEKGNSCCDLHQKSKDGRMAWDVFLKTTQ